MLRAKTHTPTIAGADHQRALDLPVCHIGDLGHFIGDVIETHRDEIREHDFGDGAKPRHRRTHGRPQNGLLGNRRIAHPQWPELFIEADGGLEHAAGLGHVFAQEHDILVAVHFLGNAADHRIAIAQFRHAQPPSA